MQPSEDGPRAAGKRGAALRRSTWPWILGLLALAAGLRLAAMEQVAPYRLVGDEVYYVMVATHLAEGQGYLYRDSLGVESRALRPPAHAAILSLLVGGGRRPLLQLQVALGTLLVVLTACLARTLFDARTGLAAGLIAALDPTLVAYSHYLWSETLFAVLVTAALIGVVRGGRAPGVGVAALSGLLFGAAALTREIAIPVAAACALWWATAAPRGLRRRAAARGALLLACATLVVLPWSYRNYTVFGRVVPVATVGWFAAAEGNTLEGSSWLQVGPEARGELIVEYSSRPDEMQRLDFARRYTLERIRAEQPTWIFKKLVRTAVRLLGPDESIGQKIRAGAYRDATPALARAFLGASVLYDALLVLAGIWGIAGARGRPRRLLPCLVLGVVVALHVVANATSRFRMPWMPLLIAYASHALLNRPGLPGVRAPLSSEE